MAVVAFFDLDRTLIDVNSALLWARHERLRGRISRAQLARAALWGGLYHLALVDAERAFEVALRHYRGEPAHELERLTRRWFVEQVAPRLRPGAAAALEQHRAAGHRLVLLTSSSAYQAAAAAEAWRFDGWIANHFPVDAEGRLLGTVDRPVCFGPGKVARAEAWAARVGCDLAEAFFYSDSYTDLPMLARVGQPRVVAPDPRLRREAGRRGWQILSW